MAPGITHTSYQAVPSRDLVGDKAHLVAPPAYRAVVQTPRDPLGAAGWCFNPWYQLPTLSCILLALVIAALLWRYRASHGARFGALMMLGIAGWTLGALGASTTWEIRTAIAWVQAGYFGNATVVTSWLLAVISFLGLLPRLPRWLRVALWAPPALTLLFAWTLEYHPWLYRHATVENQYGVSVLTVEYGPWLNAFVVYCYLLVAAGLALLVRELRRCRAGERAPIIALGVSVLLPLAGWLLYRLPLTPMRQLDYTAIGFLASGVSLLLAVRRMHLSPIPFSLQRAIVRGMDDGVLVVDADGRVVDINAAGLRLFGLSAVAIAGRALEELLPAWRFPARHEMSQLLEHPDGSGRLFLCKALPDYPRSSSLRCLLLHEVTEGVDHLEERATRRFAQHLHDEIGQTLSAGLMQLQAVRRLATDPGVEARLAAAVTALTQTEREVRALVLGTRPVGEIGEDIAGALGALCAGMEAVSPFVVAFQAPGGAIPLTPHGRRVVYRSVRELLFNALKHARARRVEVALAWQGARLEVAVEDDGVGCAPRPAKGPSYGLESIRQQVAALGGTLHVDTPAAHAGTRVILRLPLSAAAVRADAGAALPVRKESGTNADLSLSRG